MFVSSCAMSKCCHEVLDVLAHRMPFPIRAALEVGTVQPEVCRLEVCTDWVVRCLVALQLRGETLPACRRPCCYCGRPTRFTIPWKRRSERRGSHRASVRQPLPSSVVRGERAFGSQVEESGRCRRLAEEESPQHREQDGRNSRQRRKSESERLLNRTGYA
jgi:hypothetical protein